MLVDFCYKPQSGREHGNTGIQLEYANLNEKYYFCSLNSVYIIQNHQLIKWAIHLELGRLKSNISLSSSKPGGSIGLHFRRATDQMRVLHCKLYEGHFFNDRVVDYVQCFNSHLQIPHLASWPLMWLSVHFTKDKD